MYLRSHGVFKGSVINRQFRVKPKKARLSWLILDKQIIVGCVYCLALGLILSWLMTTFWTPEGSLLFNRFLYTIHLGRS